MNDLAIPSNRLAIYDIQKSVLSEFREAEKLKCEDAGSRKILGKFRADAKSIRAKISKARLAKNREQTTLNNDAAKAINGQLSASIEAYDVKIKDYDQIAINEANERKRIKDERVKAISDQIESLTKLCSTPLEYNVSSENIKFRISMIGKFEVDEETFHEDFIKAEILKTYGLSQAGAALLHRNKWEADQEENERIRIDNEKRKAALDQIEKEREDKATKELESAAAAKMKADKEAEELKAREAAVKAKEDELKRKEEQAALDKRIAWAHDMFDDKKLQLHGDAVSENATFDDAEAWAIEIDAGIEKEKLKADAERAKVVTKDKKIIQYAVEQIDGMLSKIDRLECNTEEADAVLLKLHESINIALDTAKKTGINLS